MFWLDPNPNPNKKFGFGFGFGFGFRHCCGMKIFVKKSKIKHLKEKNLMFSIENFFFSDVHVPEHI
jgi:hypothetical protein